MPEKGNCQTLNMDRSSKPKHRIASIVFVLCTASFDFVYLDLTTTIVFVVADPMTPFLLLV